MEAEEALSCYCRRMFSVVRGKQLKRGSSVRGRENQTTRGAKSSECRMRTGGGESSKVVAGAGIRRSPHGTESLPEPRLVPVQLITMLRLKTAQENISRAAKVELHDPAACCECEQEQACVALKGFIRRKKTQLQFQTLERRLNIHLGHEHDNHSLSDSSVPRTGIRAESPSSSAMPLAGFGRNYSVDICGSQQPGVALETAKEHGVALATDEMRGYPDKKLQELI